MFMAKASSMLPVAVAALFLIPLADGAPAAKVFRAMKEPRHLRWVNRALGGMFVTAGIALATFRRAAAVI